MYELACSLAVNQIFDKWKEKNTPGIYSGMYKINTRTVSLAPSLSMGRLSPQFHVSFDPSFTTINDCDGNIVLPSYWHDMCGFKKGNKSLFVYSEQHDPSSNVFNPSYQGHNNSDNSEKPWEQA